MIIEIYIYNEQGQLIRILINDKRSAGVYQVNWDGSDEGDNTVAAGIYLYCIRADEFAEIKK